MLNTLEAVLVMVDFQGKLEKIVDRSELVVPNALRLIKGCQALDVPILATAQVPEKLGPIITELEAPINNIEIISKSQFSALREPEFMLALEKSKRRQIILAGIEAHVCVLQTGLDLLDGGYQVHVLSDGVFSRTVENHDLALKRLYDHGATLSSVEIALFEMVRTSKHPAFRIISKLVK